MRPVEDDGMPDDATNRGSTGFTEGRCSGFLVRRLAEADLDQLVTRERFIERARNRITHAAFTHENDRLQRVGEAP